MCDARGAGSSHHNTRRCHHSGGGWGVRGARRILNHLDIVSGGHVGATAEARTKSRQHTHPLLPPRKRLLNSLPNGLLDWLRRGFPDCPPQRLLDWLPNGLLDGLPKGLLDWLSQELLLLALLFLPCGLAGGSGRRRRHDLAGRGGQAAELQTSAIHLLALNPTEVCGTRDTR